MATLTRNDLATKIRDKFGFTAAHSARLVDVVFEEISEALANGEEVKLAGFGTFRILEKSPRMGRNPKTGAAAIIPARRVASFRPSSEFRARVSNKD